MGIDAKAYAIASAFMSRACWDRWAFATESFADVAGGVRCAGRVCETSRAPGADARLNQFACGRAEWDWDSSRF